MARRKALFLFGVLVVLALGNTGLAQRVDTGSGTFLQGISTTSAVMIFAPFVSNVVLPGPGAGSAPIVFDTALVISNPLAFPNNVASQFLAGGADQEGNIELYCYNLDGALIYLDSSSDPELGEGLSPAGTLGPGDSWTLLFSDVLEAVSMSQPFNGHCYVVGHMDGLTGVSTVSGFSLGFSQTTTMTPALGQGPTTMIGIPVMVP